MGRTALAEQGPETGEEREEEEADRRVSRNKRRPSLAFVGGATNGCLLCTKEKQAQIKTEMLCSTRVGSLGSRAAGSSSLRLMLTQSLADPSGVT